MQSITVLRLKLESCDGLEQLGEMCRVGRCAAVENWLLRQRGLPETAEQSTRLCRRKTDREDQPKSESTKLYHAIRAVVPTLGTTQASMIARAVWSNLGAKVDWRRQLDAGKVLRRRDDILSYFARPPFFSGDEIPLHNAHTSLSYGDTVKLLVNRPSSDIAELRLNISLRGLPTGKKRLLLELSTGRRKLRDSTLVRRSKGWYWHVPVRFEVAILSEECASLVPVISSDVDVRPFKLILPDIDRPWCIGDGRYLLAQVTRLIGIRKAIGWRYRHRVGSGHGRRKIDVAVRKRRQQQRNIVDEVRRRAIADVVRQCVRHHCGVLHYREPSLPLRKKCWFEAVGIDWDWTRFGADLKNSAARKGVEVRKKQLQWKEAMGGQEAEEATVHASV